jgi:GT2 family glycosyltransferase
VNCSILIGTHGGVAWAELAWSRAYPSCASQGAYEVLVRHETNATLAEVRNALAAEAKGDWLCHVDADDELEPGYLDAMAAAIDGEPDWSPLLVPAVRYVEENVRLVLAPAGVPNRGRWPTTNECVIGTLIRRECFEQVGGFREWPIYEDWDLWLRAHKAGACLEYVEDAVYRAHIRPGGRNYSANPRETYDRIWAEYVA